MHSEQFSQSAVTKNFKVPLLAGRKMVNCENVYPAAKSFQALPAILSLLKDISPDRLCLNIFRKIGRMSKYTKNYFLTIIAAVFDLGSNWGLFTFFEIKIVNSSFILKWRE